MWSSWSAVGMMRWSSPMNTTATTPPTTIRRGCGRISRRRCAEGPEEDRHHGEQDQPHASPTCGRSRCRSAPATTGRSTLRTTSTPISSTTITAIATSTPAANPARTPASATCREVRARPRPPRAAEDAPPGIPTRSGGVQTRIFPSVIWIPDQVPGIERGHHADRGEIQDGDAPVRPMRSAQRDRSRSIRPSPDPCRRRVPSDGRSTPAPG